METSGDVTHRRFRLGDALVWVAGAALWSVLARVVRDDWRHITSVPLFFDATSDRLTGPLMMSLAVVVGLRLVTQAVGVLSQTHRPVPGARGAFAWRLVALATLLTIGLSSLELHQTGRGAAAFGPRDDARRILLPLSGSLLIAGLLSGMRTPEAITVRRPSLARLGATLALAGLLGVVFVAGNMAIPHLVMVALEAVSNAMHHPAHVPHVPLAWRIQSAWLPASLSLGAVVTAAAVLSRGLRLAAAGRPAFRRWSSFFLGLSVAASAGAAWYLVVRTIPDLDVCLMPGVLGVLGSGEVAALALGFFGLGAGLVAVAYGRTEASGVVPRRGLAGKLAWCIFLLVVSAAAIAHVHETWGPGSSGYGLLGSRVLKPSELDWVGRLDWLWNWSWSAMFPPLIAVPVGLWLVCETWRLCGPTAPDRMTAFDAAMSTAGAARVVALAGAFAVVCLAALPTLFVAGLVVYQIRLMGPAEP